MKNYLVSQSNQLVQSTYSLTLNERRLLLACIAQLDSRLAVDSTKPVTLTIEDAHDLFFSEQKQFEVYRELEQASRRLFEREVTIFNEDKTEEVLTRWIQSIEFNHKKRQIELYFAVGVLPYISQLKDKFTQYRLGNISQLSSVYAIRVYELIVMWASQNQSYKELEVDEFKILLDISNKYRQIGELNARVITPCVEQINANTDFELEIQLRKIGRSFRFIQFRFNQKGEAAAAEAAKKLIRVANQAAKQKRTKEKTKPPKNISAFSGLEQVLFKKIKATHPEITEKYVREYAEQAGLDIVQALEKIKAEYKSAEEFTLEKTDQ